MKFLSKENLLYDSPRFLNENGGQLLLIFLTKERKEGWSGS